MRAIIVAAGKGERLYPLTKDTPKCLLKVYNNQSILDYQVNLFRECGVDEIVVVVGYLAHKIEKYLQSFSNSNMKIITIYNPFYSITNSIVSCWMAREYMKDDFLLINGDTIIHETVLLDLLQSKHDICLAVSEKKEYRADDMKVILDEKCTLVKDVSNKIPLRNTDGASVGFFKFQNNSGLIYKKTLEKMFRVKKNLHVFHHNVIRQIIRSGEKVSYRMVDNALWKEIDLDLDIELLRYHTELSSFDER